MRNKALLLVILAAARAQTPVPNDKPASIEGAVTHATTGAPLPRVHVTLRGYANGTPRQYGAMTTPDGRFSVTGIIPGDYTITAERTGFVMAARAPGATLKAGEKKSDLDLKLIPTGALSGRVTDSEGEPVEGAAVYAEGLNGDAGTTDEKGQFRIGGLAPGRYRVNAAFNSQLPLRPEIRTDGTVDVRNARTYYPGVLTAKEAGRVEVRADGETGGVDIRLVRVPWVRVSGRITGFGATDRMFVTAQKEGAAGQGLGGHPAKPDGTFELWHLDPGRYYISAGGNSPGGQYMRTGPVVVDVAASNIDRLELRFVPSFDLAGRLEYETEEAKQLPQPPPASSNTAPNPAQQTKPHRRVTLRDATTSFGQGGEAQVQDDDTFVFPKVSPGIYRIVLSWETAWVKSARLGSTVSDSSLIDLSSGASGGELSVMLSAANASVSGVVQDEKEKPAGTVVVLVKDQDPAGPFLWSRYAPVKQDGTYSFPNLAPGSYGIAIQRNDTIRSQQPGGVLDYDDLMETIEVHAGEKLTKDLNRRAPGER